MKFEHLTRAILSKAWAIDPDSYAWAAICDVLALRAAGETLSLDEIEARISAANNGPRTGGARARNVAVIPVYGVISPRTSGLGRSSGGTSAETVRDEFRAALADQDVDGIVFDIDSPGGVVEGMGELADEIRASRGTKPISAVANHMAASAAYWLAAGADEIVATPSATVGSIGVFTAHQDVSAAMEQKGIRTTLISAGKFKVEGNEYAPLADEARAEIQARVDEWYGIMTSSIAKGRGTGVDAVRSATYGEGRGVLAKAALERGMVDRIDSLENTIRRVARGAVGNRPSAAAFLNGDGLAASAGTFVDRVDAATAEIRELRALTVARAALRASDGREPSAADLRALAALRAAVLAEDTDPEVDEDEETEDQEEEQTTPPEPVTARRRDLEILEAATRGGYLIPA